jgi:7-cyano-7-deazaguanine synthase
VEPLRGTNLTIVARRNRPGGSILTANLDHFLPATNTGIPATYVPARNTVFLSFALAWAEVLGATDIFIGVNAVDYSGYPDCRPEFIEAFQRTANLATRMGVEGSRFLTIHTPLIHLTKAEIIRTGLVLGVDYSLTLTCYDPSLTGEACGSCDACQLRRKGFEENGLVDPARYITQSAVVV